MKRAENCKNFKIKHVYFESDSLVFDFSKSKGNKDSGEHSGLWHVYVNPLDLHF